MIDDQEQNDTDDQEIVDDSETATVPIENGPWEDDEDFFLNYQY